MNELGNKKKKSLRATNIELESRDTSVSSDDKKIYLRDSDNLYPLRLEKVINNSPTGKRCSNLMSKYIIGNGALNNVTINKKGENLNSLAKKASQDIATQYGVVFHISYALDVENSVSEFNFKKDGVKILDYVQMAKSKNDDSGFSGKIYILEVEEKSNIFSKTNDKSIWFYPYNTNKKVILSQMRNDCKLAGVKNPTIQQLVQNYRGQVYYLNLTPKYHYSLPIWDVVYNDMDSEHRISIYVNKQIKDGWLGKTVISKFDDDEEEDERKPDSFNENLKKNMGAENASNVLVIDVPVNATDDVKKAFNVEQLKPQYDDKLFELTLKNLRKNIMGAFNNAPEILLTTGDGSLFGTNSDTYNEAKKFYWEQNEWERQCLEEALTEITGEKVSFIPIVEEQNFNEDESLRKKSQAEFKGSVGGVTALLEIQKSVANKTTDINAAVEIIKEIFGISEDVARKML